MNIVNNYYQETDYRYTEIGIALEDFTYGGDVSISIPTITPFMDNTSTVESTETVSTVNIINDDTTALGITTYESRKVSTGNSMTLKVPWYLADTEILTNRDNDYISISKNGTKGTKFIISFVGGQLDNARIIGRMD